MATLKEMMAAKKAQIAQNSGKGEKTVTPQVGSTRYRILPSWRELSDPAFYHDFGQHFIRDKKGVLVVGYIVCAEKTFAKPCVICDAIREGIFDATTDEEKALLKGANARDRVLLNVLDIDKDASTPIILELTGGTFDQLIDIYQQNADKENESFNILTDINEGVDIIITRTGVGLKTEYSIQPAIKGSKPVSAAILAKLNDLDKFVVQEQALGIAKATAGVKAILGGPAQKAISSRDEAFDDDVPFHNSPKAGSDDVIEGSYKEVDEGAVSEDELNALLDDLDD